MKQLILLLTICSSFFHTIAQEINITVDLSQLDRKEQLYLGVDGTLRPVSEDADTMMFKTSVSPNLMDLVKIKKGKITRLKKIFVKDELIKIIGSVGEEAISVVPHYPQQLITDKILELNQPNLKKESELAYTEPYLIHLYSKKDFIKNEYYEELVAHAPSDVSEFWAMTKIRSYLNSQGEVGYDPQNKVFSHLQAMDKSKKAVDVIPIQEKYLLIDFSASGCGYCIIDIDKLVDIQQNFQAEIELISLWHDPSYEIWTNSSKKEKDKISWTNLYDESGGIFKAFNIRAYPTYLLIDPSGKIVKKWEGGLTAEKLETYLPTGDDE